MAYVDQKSGRERTVSAIASAALVAAIGYAAMTGLAVRIIKSPTVYLPTASWQDPPPPPPEIVPEPPMSPRTAISTPVPVPLPPPPIPLPPLPTTIDLKPPTLPASDGAGSIGQGTSTSTTPPLGRPATAIGDRAAWVTSDDYPPAAQRAGAEGRTLVTLAIGTDGRVTGCTLTATSGSSDLDRAACQALTRHARFRPARDDAGTAIPTRVPDSVVWRLPRE